MRIKTGALLTCLLLLFFTAVTALPGVAINGRACSNLYAQETHDPGQATTPESGKGPDSSATLYQVMAVVLFIWFGLAFFLFRLDRRVAKLEKKLNLKQ
jgi:CcmD family protein